MFSRIGMSRSKQQDHHLSHEHRRRGTGGYLMKPGCDMHPRKELVDAHRTFLATAQKRVFTPNIAPAGEVPRSIPGLHLGTSCITFF